MGELHHFSNSNFPTPLLNYNIFPVNIVNPIVTVNSSIGGFYIGLRWLSDSNHTWVWDDGTPTNYFNWGPGKKDLLILLDYWILQKNFKEYWQRLKIDDPFLIQNRKYSIKDQTPSFQAQNRNATNCAKRDRVWYRLEISYALALKNDRRFLRALLLPFNL